MSRETTRGRFGTGTQSRGSLLFIDPDEDALARLRAEFGRNYDVYLARSLDEAREILGQGRIHVVVVDQTLLGPDNAGFLGQLRREFSAVRRLVLAGPLTADAVRLVTSNAHLLRHAPKPYNFPDLHKVIEQTLDQPGRQAQDALEQRIHALEAELAEAEKRLDDANLATSLMEQSLRESEGLFRVVADTIPVMIWIDNPEGNCVFVNRPWIDFTGQELEPDLGRRGAETMHPEDLLGYVDTYHWALHAQNGYGMEYRLRRHDGEFRWVRETAAPRFASDGSFAGFVGSCVDVTDRKRMEDHLRSSQNFIQHIADAVPDILYVYDLVEARNIYINQAILYTLGYSPVEIQNLAGSFIPALMHPDDLAGLPAITDRFSNAGDGDIVELEYRLKRKNGEWRWFYDRSTVFTRTPAGQPCQIVGLAQDITGRRKAEADLQASQHLVQKIADTFPDVIYVYDLAEQRYIYSSHDIAQTLGHDLGSDLKKGYEAVNQLMHPDDRPEEANRRARMLAAQDGEIVEFEYRLRCADGGWRWYSIRQTVFSRAEGGQPRQILGIAQNITERKLAEQAALALAVERRKTEALESFIRDTSHDFRTPISVLLTSTYLIGKFTDQLLRQAKQVESYAPAQRLPDLNTLLAEMDKTAIKVHQHATASQESANRLQRLVEVLLNMVRLEYQIGMEFAVHDLNQVVEPIVEASRARAEEHSILLTFSPGVALPGVRVDGDEFGQAVQNLIENALQYTPGGGKVAVQTYRSGDEVVVEVSDTGIGIGEVDLPHIFERFYRADRARSANKGGMGLGLTIVKKVIEAHQGRIDVQSTPGRGSIFRLYLPAQNTTEPALPPH